MEKLSFREISADDVEMIEKFLRNAESALQSFRYFSSRPLTVIRNHVVTVLITFDDNPIGYGHLDRDGNNVWLGIALADEARGRGLGVKMMDYLINKAKNIELSEVLLTVDKDNLQAIKLYHKCGFQTVKDMNERSLLMKLPLNNI